jgi:hypothetical protein
VELAELTTHLHREHYISFLPHIDITAWTIKSWMFSRTSGKGTECPAFLLKSIELVHLDYHSSWQNEETVAVLIFTKLLSSDVITRVEGFRRVKVEYYGHELQFLLVRGDGQGTFHRVGTWFIIVWVKKNERFQV